LSTLNSGRLRLYEADGLRDELLGLRLVQNAAGAWTFDHRPGGHDDRATALALMAVALLEHPTGHDWPTAYACTPCKACDQVYHNPDGTRPCPSCGNSLPEHEQARLRERQELLRVSNEWRDAYTPNRGSPGEWLAQIQRRFG
jgi:hypothetical protein